jgi:hypothetical protein
MLGRKPMTIAACFNFVGGVMTCADTEVTEGSLANYHEQKIIPIDSGLPGIPSNNKGGMSSSKRGCR